MGNAFDEIDSGSVGGAADLKENAPVLASAPAGGYVRLFGRKLDFEAESTGGIGRREAGIEAGPGLNIRKVDKR